MSSFELQYTEVSAIRSRVQQVGASLANCSGRLRRQATRLNDQKGFGIEQLRGTIGTAAGAASARSQEAYAIASFLAELSASVTEAENAAYSLLAGAIPQEPKLIDAVVPWLPAYVACPDWSMKITLPVFGFITATGNAIADWKKRREEAARRRAKSYAAINAIKKYIPRAGKDSTRVTKDNYDEYRAEMKEYIRQLEEKGYDCCQMNAAFRMAEAVGKKDQGRLVAEIDRKYANVHSERIGALSDNEFAMYSNDNALGGNEVAIAFQGTDISWGDWMSNIGDGWGDIHNGYYKRAKEIFEHNASVGGVPLSQMIEDAKAGKTTFTLTGHSMGGAMAQCFAILLMDAGVPASQITGYTFNCALPIKESNPYYSKDISFFNINNQTDNVSNGDIVGFRGDGVRMGYDIPIADLNHTGYDVGWFASVPNSQHGMDYLGDRINADKSVIGCTKGHCSFQ